MIKSFIQWLKEVWQKVFRKDTIESAIGVSVQVSDGMMAAIELWERMYTNAAPWLSDTIVSLQLPAAIASEFARLITLELKSEIQGSLRADWLNQQYERALEGLQAQVEQGVAFGGMAFKPYITEAGTMAVDFTPADRFLPTKFDGSGGITGGIFVDRQTRGKDYYTRFEYHELAGTTYAIRNVAYKSTDAKILGAPASLGELDDWAGLEEEISLGGITRTLFGYFKVPLANTVDRASPLGVSVYARAVDQIRQVDEHWARIQWELKGTELAIDISDRAFRPDPKTGQPIIPSRHQRLFRPSALNEADKPLYEVFSPDVRIDAYDKALNSILRRIEFNCNLAYGTLSDPNTVDKTAEEIRSSKQRSFSAVSSMQRALQAALDNLVYAVDVWATVGKLAPAGKYEISFAWGDGINDDPDKEFAQRLQLVAAGIDRPDEMRMYYHGETREDAVKNLPTSTGLLEG